MARAMSASKAKNRSDEQLLQPRFKYIFIFLTLVITELPFVCTKREIQKIMVRNGSSTEDDTACEFILVLANRSQLLFRISKLWLKLGNSAEMRPSYYVTK